VVGHAGGTITQHVVVLKEEEKWAWLFTELKGILTKFGSGDQPAQCIIFTKSKAKTEDIAERVKQRLGLACKALHGDVDQDQRMEVMRLVRERKLTVLVATDVAARGLDIASIRVVICYDSAGTIDTHTHRIGRTGRAGAKGDAYTLVTPEDVRFAGPLVHSLEVGGQIVPKELVEIARKDLMFKQHGPAAGKPGTLDHKPHGIPGAHGSIQFEKGHGDQGHLGDESGKTRSKTVSSSDDEDLYAPGVTKAFGGAARGRK
jgi:ATP-dependent RNA helicase DDX42